MDGTPDRVPVFLFFKIKYIFDRMWNKINIAELAVANFAGVILLVAMVRNIRKQKRLLREERVRREVGI